MDRKVIGIYGVPRTGTSWLGELFNSSNEVIYKFQPQFSYKYRGRIREDSTFSEIKECFDEMLYCQDSFVDQLEERITGKLPIFEKKEINDSSVLVYKEARFIYTIENILKKYPAFKAVLIIRNPIDTLNSWINAPREFNESWDINSEWKEAKLKNNGLEENFFGYNKWKEALKIFLDLSARYADRVKIVKYEDLCVNTEYEVKKLFFFSEINFSFSTYDFIRKSQKYTVNDPYSVYRNRNLSKAFKRNLDIKIVEDIKCDLSKDKNIKRIWMPVN